MSIDDARIVDGSPGVYREDRVRRTPPEPGTGVPAFLGFTGAGPAREPFPVTRRSDARRELGAPGPGAQLASAVDGFFVNGGRSCWVVPLGRDTGYEAALEAGLEVLAAREEPVDLVCAPGLVPSPGPEPPGRAEIDRALRLQALLLSWCGWETGWFAILDGVPGADPDAVLRQSGRLRSPDGAVYWPWIRVAGPEAAAAGSGAAPVPPCGHVAGVFARVDRAVGVHKAPANEILEGVVDLELPVTVEIQARLNPAGVNCLRSFPGRGIRVWGARTLSGLPAWRHVNVRRLVLTIGRLVERDLSPITFEPHGPELWARVRGLVAGRLTRLHRDGALRGRTPAEAFHVKCDAETNPPEVRAAGRIVVEVGVAPNGPLEFVVVRLVQDARGLAVQEPTEAARDPTGAGPAPTEASQEPAEVDSNPSRSAREGQED